MKIKFRGKTNYKKTSESKGSEKYERPEEHMNMSTKRVPAKKKIQPIFGNTSQ
jgi:hypothetical protein